MRLAAFAAALLLLTACGEKQSDVLAGGRGSATPSPAATPTPDVAFRLMDRVRNMTAIVRRADRIARCKRNGARSSLGAASKAATAIPTRTVWIVAVVGEIYPSFGVMDMGASACGTFVFGLAGNVKSSGASSLSGCAPYFADSLVPPSAPVVCGPKPHGYAVFDRFNFSPTIPGPVHLMISRDDTWVQPRTVPGPVLYEGIDQYETYCRPVHAATVPGKNDTRMLVGLGSPRVSSSVGLAQIWLKDVHAISASAGANGVVTVLAERKSGFEIDSYDWHALAPQGGYIKFRFVDATGADVIVYAVADGP
jgi:hypothetical protein